MILAFAQAARATAALLAASVLAGTPALARRSSIQPATNPAPAAVAERRPVYLRVAESSNGKTLALEVAIRRFLPGDGAGPEVSLAGAVHIGDRKFYTDLQEYLDTKEIVLFEGVKPPGAGSFDRIDGDDSGVTEDDRIEATRRRIRFLGAATEAYKRRHRGYPASLQSLAAAAPARVRFLLKPAADDAWGNALIYTVLSTGVSETTGEPVRDGPFDIVSFGADGRPGGDGPAMDLSFSDLPALKPGEIGMLSDDESDEEGGGEGGIQQEMAKALGLVFQLDAMDHDRANWRNSDLSVDQVQDRLDRAGADSGALFGMLDGSSFTATIGKFFLRLVGASPTGSAMLKLAMVEVLSNADLLVSRLPGEMAAVMDVLIKDRNAVVIDDLRALIEDEPGIASVGIIYGAGHMPDLERRLSEELGYEYSDSTWLPAITLDLAKVGIPPAQAKQMRAMIRTTIDRQLKAAQRLEAKQRKGR